MTKGRVALPFGFDVAEDEPQIPPLRYATVGMTKGKVALPFRFGVAEDELQVPLLRYPGLPARPHWTGPRVQPSAANAGFVAKQLCTA